MMCKLAADNARTQSQLLALDVCNSRALRVGRYRRVRNNYSFHWPIAGTSSSGGDRIDNIATCLIGDFTKDGVLAIQVWGWTHCDEEL